MHRSMLIATLLSLVVSAAATPSAMAIFIPDHVTDGNFTGAEWIGVNPLFFPVVGDTGGSFLYVAQENGNLYLLYDYVNSPALGMDPTAVSTFFDVFFEVTSDNEDYVAHFGTNPAGSPPGYVQTPLDVYVKSHATASSVNPDGSLNLSDPVWTHLTSSDPDFLLGQFQSAVGFGPSPNYSTDHLIGEFQLTIDTNAFTPGGSDPANGLYDPAPAFWSTSANADSVVADPPISSAIFTLNPDGSTTVAPLFGPNGGPVTQPQDVATPEPASLLLLGSGAVGLLGFSLRRRRKRGREQSAGL